MSRRRIVTKDVHEVAKRVGTRNLGSISRRELLDFGRHIAHGLRELANVVDQFVNDNERRGLDGTPRRRAS